MSPTTTESVAMVRYWRLRNASAPSWMASEIVRISGGAVVHLQDPARQQDGDEEREDAHGQNQADDHGIPVQTVV